MAKSIWVQSYCEIIRDGIPSARHFTSQQFGISAYLTSSIQLQRGESPESLGRIWWDRRNADLRFVLNSWQYDKYMALTHFYRPVAWKAGGWTFAVYTHYGRDRFYNAHPRVFVSYKGGHNRVHGSHYAHMHKPAPKAPMAKHSPAPAAKPHNNATWRNTDNARQNMTYRANGHSNANRQIAQNTNNSRNGHFGGRR